MEPSLSDEEQKVWDILSTPHKPPTIWDDLSPDAISRIINSLKMALDKGVISSDIGTYLELR